MLAYLYSEMINSWMCSKKEMLNCLTSPQSLFNIHSNLFYHVSSESKQKYGNAVLTSMPPITIMVSLLVYNFSKFEETFDDTIIENDFVMKRVLLIKRLVSKADGSGTHIPSNLCSSARSVLVSHVL